MGKVREQNQLCYSQFDIIEQEVSKSCDVIFSRRLDWSYHAYLVILKKDLTPILKIVYSPSTGCFTALNLIHQVKKNRMKIEKLLEHIKENLK